MVISITEVRLMPYDIYERDRSSQPLQASVFLSLKFVHREEVIKALPPQVSNLFTFLIALSTERQLQGCLGGSVS